MCVCVCMCVYVPALTHDTHVTPAAQGGRFYLPYRHHYSHEQLLAAYPEFPAWVAAKHEFDPACVFSNEWFREYGAPYWPQSTLPPSLRSPPPASSEVVLHAWEEAEAGAGFELRIVSERRSKSMQELLDSPLLWKAFRDEFLVNIFNLVRS